MLDMPSVQKHNVEGGRETYNVVKFSKVEIQEGKSESSKVLLLISLHITY